MFIRYLIGAILLIIIACNADKQSIGSNDRPNIVWINAEDISPAFGIYGDSLAITPNIDALAKQGVVFNRAYAVSPICSPSRSTLVTGIQATSLGTQHLRSETPFPKELETLPELMRNAGYFTSIYGKTDYNFDPEGLWEYWHDDESPWRQRKDNRPFLSVFTLNYTHEGKGNSRSGYDKVVKNLPTQLRHEPGSVPAPIYYPQTDESRDLWTRYYDLVTIFDQKVGEIIDNLKQDGELDNTIIFIHSDHGFGMPRYKRWLYETGLRVPLVVFVPDKFKHLSPYSSGTQSNDLISFIDFVPTALALTSIKQPEFMQGNPFMGNAELRPNQDLFAFRSRADNVYEMSRAVRNQQYLYIRHYMPHLPYIQKSKIFSDDKESYRMLWRMYHNNELSEESLKMFATKPIEELYDLENDPNELNNLAFDPKYSDTLNKLRLRLKSYVIETGDLGYLYESEMVIRANGKSPYYLRDNISKYNIEALFTAAESVGKSTPDQTRNLLYNKDSAIQFWGIMGVYQFDLKIQESFIADLKTLLESQSPTIQIAAAELLYKLSKDKTNLNIILDHLNHEVNEVKLQAARALELCAPVDENTMVKVKQELTKYRAPKGSSYPYSDYNFASFISWSLESVVENYNNRTLISLH